MLDKTLFRKALCFDVSTNCIAYDSPYNVGESWEDHKCYINPDVDFNIYTILEHYIKPDKTFDWVSFELDMDKVEESILPDDIITHMNDLSDNISTGVEAILNYVDKTIAVVLIHNNYYGPDGIDLSKTDKINLEVWVNCVTSNEEVTKWFMHDDNGYMLSCLIWYHASGFQNGYTTAGNYILLF